MDDGLLKARQNLIELTDYIAIDTSEIPQIDVDTSDHADDIDAIVFNTPHYVSVSKGLPHIFVKTDTPLNKEKYVFTDTDVNGEHKIDFLCGQWAWARKDTVVENADKEIYNVGDISNRLYGYVAEKPAQDTKSTTMDDVTKVRELLKIIVNTRANINYEEWMKIGACIKSLGLTAKDFVEFTNDPDKIEDTIEHWHRFTDKGITIEFLQKHAKSTNHKEYIKWYAKWHTNGEIVYCNDDNEASEYMFDKLKHVFKSYRQRLFYKQNNLWICEESVIETLLLEKILTSNIHKKSEKGKPLQYAQSVNSASNIRKALIAKIRVKNDDPDLYSKFHTTTKKCICFMDGVLNFEKKTFRLWQDIGENEIYTTQIIQRNFKQYFDKPDKDVMDKIRKIIFKPLFNGKLKEALHFFSRALAGHIEDKRWATYVGNRNCGKGVLFDLLVAGFETYVKAFNLDNVLCTRMSEGNDTSDSSKKLYWLLDHEFTRLAISQETPSLESKKKINAALLKKIVGGGDTIVARRNYDRQDTYFNIDMTLFSAGNSSLQSTDNDVFETRLEYASIVQFKSKEEIEAMKAEGRDQQEMQRYHISDPNIKQKCNTVEWANAVVMLILENYKPKAVDIIVAIEDMEFTDNSLYVDIKEYFEITKNAEDIMLHKEVLDILAKHDKKKIDLELKTLDVTKKQNKHRTSDYYNKICLYGIRRRPDPSIQNSITEGAGEG